MLEENRCHQALRPVIRGLQADIAYDGQALTLTLTLTDTADPARTWTHAFAVDIPAAVGSDTA